MSLTVSSLSLLECIHRRIQALKIISFGHEASREEPPVSHSHWFRHQTWSRCTKQATFTLRRRDTGSGLGELSIFTSSVSSSLGPRRAFGSPVTALFNSHTTCASRCLPKTAVIILTSSKASLASYVICEPIFMSLLRCLCSHLATLEYTIADWTGRNYESGKP